MIGKSNRVTDYRSLSDFRYEIRRFLNFSERAARNAGLEPQQHQALLTIQGLPPHQIATISALSERLQIQHNSAVELADRLETKRLIRRSRTHQDRRAVVLELTKRGENILGEVTLPHLAELRAAGRRFLQTLGLLMKHESLNGSAVDEFEVVPYRASKQSRITAPGAPKRKRKRATR
jgi:DNA-binding MarR family transcriptional regulator